MAYTLLQYANLVMTRAGLIRSDLTALTSQGPQEEVNATISAINEIIDRLVYISGIPLPTVTDEGSITLATDDRSYAFASDFVSLVDERMVDETNQQYLLPYPGGFEALRAFQLDPSKFTGLAIYYAVDPETGEIYLDAIPTVTENGRIYKYLYNKETNFVIGSPSATFHFTDELLRQAIPAVIQVYNRDRRQKVYSRQTKEESLAMAAALLPRTATTRRSYGPDARN